MIYCTGSLNPFFQLGPMSESATDRVDNKGINCSPLSLEIQHFQGWSHEWRHVL